MALLEIRTLPDPVLREKAAPIESVDADVRKLMRDMLETMYAFQGIGLAANQVGILKRVIVLDISESRNGTEALLMANPEILERSDETFTYSEGCLSVRADPAESAPDLYADVTRPKRIKVLYTGIDGQSREIEAEDLLSTCIQHEMDHLDGVLFIDRISPLKRKMIATKVEKRKKLKES